MAQFFQLHKTLVESDQFVEAPNPLEAVYNFAAAHGFQVQPSNDNGADTWLLLRNNRVVDVVTVCPMAQKKVKLLAANTPLKDVSYRPNKNFYVEINLDTWKWEVLCDHTGTKAFSSWSTELDAEADAKSRNNLETLCHALNIPLAHT
jgi:hypothetical protein